MFEGHCFTAGHAGPARPCSDRGSIDSPAPPRDPASAGTAAAHGTDQMPAGSPCTAGSFVEPPA
jgi:hypothetical protein